MFKNFVVIICCTFFVSLKVTSQSVNLTNSKTAVQSSVSSQGGEANLAIDGNTNGDFYSGSVTQTNNETNPWWQIDLESKTNISLIQIFNRTDSFSERLTNFYVFISDSDLSGQTFSEILVDCNVQQFYVSELAGSSINIPKEISGHYVRIQLAGTGILSLAEVNIFSSILINTNCNDFCLVEDFNDLLNGSIRGQNDWETNPPGALDGAIVSSDVYNGFTGKALMNDPNGVMFRGNAYKPLKDKAINNNTIGTLFFQLLIEDVENTYSHFGLTDLVNPRLTDNGTGNIELYNDYEVQMSVDHGKFRVRNGDTNNFLTNIKPENGVIYNIWMVIDNTADKFEIYVQGGTHKYPIKGIVNNGTSLFSFRNGTSEALQTLYLLNSPDVDYGILFYDSFYVDNQKENLALPITLEQALNFSPIETFEDLNLGAIDGQNEWRSNSDIVTVAEDPFNNINQVMKIDAGSMNAYHSIPEIKNCDIGTLYFRILRSGLVNQNIGMSDVNTPSEFADYENQINLDNDSDNLYSRSGSHFLSLEKITNNTWYCVWIVTNNIEDTYQIYLQGNQDTTPKLLSSGSLTDFYYRNNTASNPLISFFIKQNSSIGTFFIDDIYIDPNEINLNHPSNNSCTHSNGNTDLSLPLTDPIAATIPVSDIGIVLEEFVTIPASSPNKPVTRINFLDHANDNTDRLFVNDLNNNLYSIENQIVSTYLDVSAQFTNFANNPRLGSGFGFFAFHPEFVTNGLFYTIHTERFDALTNITPDYTSAGIDDMHGVIIEWKASNPMATTFYGTHREVLRIGFDTGLHGFQQIGFNPNAVKGNEDYGLLYLALGDGEENPVFSNGPQDLSVPHGKLLRIDPSGNNSPNRKYGIPATNPFINTDNALGEIWAYGFRNPHRFSWDEGGTHKMFIGNIGEKNIDAIYPGIAGANYGWNEREGSFLFKKNDPNYVYKVPEDESFRYTYPVAEYDHDEGFAIVAGFVYRGDLIPELRGKYIFGDIVKGRIFFTEESEMIIGQPFTEINEFSIYTTNGVKTNMLNLADSNRADIRFGLDAQGEIYVLSKQNGKIWKITEAKSLLNISQFERNEKLQIYPNPVDGVLNIKLPTLTTNDIIISIINSLGQEIKILQIKPNANNISLAISEIPKGIYLVKTIVNNNTYINTIIKK
ncbi:PQQ-dependent sugar dehydrogenase [Wenyingzhuangia sp. chi5]|uniref:PQQ-dependent sugar dehydrogenase n=1 Tax=Wenyingzhuangia gilva TaxID=3057677 RepID=A0ABT8VUQ0_9FLAO|nr:PQQ-dependent sugar dehydrogenase [Wenyingzhuangia sp. chi5]MDO3695696.1 PQQ-dependent sugar dehydrogenase [Wenyingzhuangia sp. chi5]